MSLFRIPLLKRVVQLELLSTMEACMALDGRGFFVEYRSCEQLAPQNIRQHLVGIVHTECLVEAGSKTEAIQKFTLDYEGAMVGGASLESKALRIDPRERIVKLPPCTLLHRSKEGRYICGEEGNEGNGEFGMCVLEGFDPPDFHCPIHEFFAHAVSR